MAGRLPYIKRRKYPHMIGEDIPIWERFIEKYPEFFNSVDYDWRVGEGVIPDPEWAENYKRMVTMLSQKRIDVVGWKDDKPTIVEVKKRVGLSTLGQILGYNILFMEEFTHFPEPEILIITESIGDDDKKILEKYGIPVIVV
jgi:hypothetical protein